MRHPARLALVTLVTFALLAGVLVASPPLAARSGLLAQGTAQPERPRLPLYFFLLKPNAQFAQVLTGLNLTEKQASGLGTVLAEEARLLAVSQARGTMSLDAGPIAQASWARLESEVLTREQYETLRRWTATQDEFLVSVLRDVAAGSTALATAVATTGTPTVPPPIRDLLAALQTPAATQPAGTPAATAAGTSGPSATTVSATTTTVPATATSAPATATSAPSTATPIPTTAATGSAASAATIGTGTPPAARPAATGAALSSLTVVGQGHAEATPNVAQLSLGVETISDTVRAASNDVNQKATAIINRLKALGIADKDIQTAQYSVSPYQPPERPINPAQAGPTPTRPRPQYRVSEIVRVTVRDLNLVGQAIDGAIDAGATNVGGIQFTVEDPTPTMDQARANAFADARRRAQQLAQLAGLTLGPPIYITEIIGSAPPVARAAAPALAASAPAPIEGGQLTYTTQLQITFELR
ncbi:MAG: SIMPL domain-containing protein [Anaerolineae bacterium]|nr:SIMPL domain-containing protein [Anaerolineae bacterium]